MTAPPDDAGREPAAPVSAPAMSHDRWRAIDTILQGALEYDRDRRDAFVAGACRDDLALQREVVSLLAAHDAAPITFLERPAFEALAAPDDIERAPAPAEPLPGPSPASGGTPTSRMVSARAVIYAIAATLVVGLAGGWALDHWSFSWPWRRTAAAQPAGAVMTADAVAPPGAATGETNSLSLVVVDRTGRTLSTIPAERPWTPRFSPDGRRVAYGAFGSGRGTSDLWITRLDDGSTRRLTDDERDANDPQWSPDGSALAYSVGADGGKDVAERPTGDGTPHFVASRPGIQFPSDWRHDGTVLLVTEEARGKHDVLVQPDDGSPARQYATTDADETSARFSPDGRWVAYTSDESGRPEVYVDGYPMRGSRVQISSGGGADPVWRGDGKELYYWRGDDLVAVRLDPGSGRTPPSSDGERVLFRAKYHHVVNTMYDVSPDGQRFVMVVRR